jgi:hypothetical protein
MARYDDLDTKTIAFSAVISSVILLILILGGRALAYSWEFYVKDERLNNAVYHSSNEAISAQKGLLNKSGQVEDPPVKEGDKPVVRNVVPIKQAEELVAKELGK